MGSDLGTKQTRHAENPNAKDRSNDRDSGFALARPVAKPRFARLLICLRIEATDGVRKCEVDTPNAGTWMYRQGRQRV
jgi:hypothetical protein